MNRDVFMDAVGYLDTDILAQHLQQKDRLRHNPQRKLRVWKWSAIAASICVVIALGSVIVPNLMERFDPIIDTGLESGFKPLAGSEETLFNFCAYKSDTNEFDINDVTLDFYYGGYFYNGIEFALENDQNYPTFDLYFVNDQGDRCLVKHSEENFVSDKYSCEVVFDENGYMKEIKYNHSEQLTIPAELFTKQSGQIWLEIEGVNILETEPENRKDIFITGICIFYKVNNGQIILSSQKFD